MDVLQGGRRFISRRSILPGYYELHRNLPLLLLLLLLLLPSRSLEILIISWIERFRHILRTLKVTYILFHACIFIFKSKGRRRLPWMLINFVISRVWIKHDILRFLTSPAIFTVFVKPRVFRRRWREGEGGEGEGRARWWSLKINYQSRLWVKPRRFVFVQRNIMEVTVSCTEIASEYSLS